MTNTIRIKRSTGSSAPTSLENAELAYAEGTNILYYGTGTGGAGGSATSIEAIGGDGYYNTLSTAQTISGNKTFTGTLDFSSATVQTFTCAQNLIVSGNLTVSGTTTTVNSTTTTIADKNLELAKGAANDAAADGGGITIDSGEGDKTWNWINSTDSWTSSEHIEIASGKTFRINANNVLSQTTLGSTVVGSSLTSVGTIGTGVWAATDVAIAHGGTGASTASGALTNLGLTATAAELNALDGITSTVAELNVLDGITSTVAELNILDGVTSTAAELNALDGITSTVAELNIVDGGTSATSTTLATTDRFVVNDSGTMVQVALSDLVTFLENGSVSGFDVDGGTY
tara:strand:- start:4263 stop:5297 length:1035 start_codon:yes stop_codon:yes gene_type:complete